MLMPSLSQRGAAAPPNASSEQCEITLLDGARHASIRDVETLPPFLMNVVSDGDVWLFAGSNAGLTAGRRDPDGAVFPYRPVDQLLHEPRSSGVVSLIRCDGRIWEPWAAGPAAEPISRTLSKHELGCSVVFEETHAELGLRCRWRIGGSSRFGLVRHARLENLTNRHRRIDLLDGWHRVLPPGVGDQLYARLSYLTAAYMWHEMLAPEGLLISVLNSAISDRPEPAESLRATVAWSVGLRGGRTISTEGRAEAFRRGEPLGNQPRARGCFGGYLAGDSLRLAPGECRDWFMVVDGGLDQPAILDLRHWLGSAADPAAELEASLAAEADGLRSRVAAADGVQVTADQVATAHHASNTLFNIMRGGLPADGSRCPPGDLSAFLGGRSRAVLDRHREWAERADGRDRDAVVAEAAGRGDPQLARLVTEYMPLCFSRRHGDPSRPWNRFSIRTRDRSGRPLCGYAGNWRDIFQNWEALAHSYPTLLPAMVAAFLNATTADGYNAYRITREGIDWEVPDPTDPWGHIGYWGDHQIVYLLRLLEAQERFWPGQLAARLNEALFSHAVVPYRILGFDEICRDPRNSIRFEPAVHCRLLEQAEAIGGDGRLLPGPDGEPLLASLVEKLLVPALVKLTNLVPGGGIWLNTQRPEWNDANNALAGWGLSLVTVCYLRRFLSFVDRLLAAAAVPDLQLSTLAAPLVEDLTRAMRDGGSDAEMAERLGRAGERHRQAVYAVAFDGQAPAAGPAPPIAVAAVRAMLARGIDLLDETIRRNRRPDGLYHAYNVLAEPPGRAAAAGPAIRHLEPMLEGQVAVLSSGLSSDDEAVEVLAAIRRSPLYRADQRSYLLQPDREPVPFLDRNRLPADWRERVPTLAARVDAGAAAASVLARDGTARFAADLTNAQDLRRAVAGLADLPAAERAAAEVLWEEVFRHQEFTGRSGTFFAFEGLGSIYWHMVAKLLVAVQECHARAAGPARQELAAGYRRIREGLGFRKSAAEYGAFPTDAYSHTPRHAGAQQPGMTGQVKEELLTRLAELGVQIEAGGVRFAPEQLPPEERMPAGGTLSCLDPTGRQRSLPIPAGGLGFTLCQVPVLYRFDAPAPAVTIHRADGSETIPGDTLPPRLAGELFRRTGSITAIEVALAGHGV
jgi:hypothetical protein